MHTVRIVAEKPYDIAIEDGLIDNCGREIAALFRPARLALASDDAAFDLYGKRALKSLRQAGFDVRTHVLKGGERGKGMAALGGLLEFLGENHFLKTDQLVWLGGGALGDVAGMAASMYLGGMYLVQMPTTLVAALDKAVGSRALIQLKSGQEVGIPAQPSLALCDTAALGELPEGQIRDGAAEMLKYALLGSEALLAMLESGAVPDRLGEAIDLCVNVKAELVGRELYDPSVRKLLQMGNTAGRAAVTCSRGKLSHGEGLAVGLVAAARAASKMLGVAGMADRVERAATACGLGGGCAYGRGEMLTAIASRKQRNEEYISITVPVEVGDCRILRVTFDELDRWLEAAGIND